MANSSEDAVRRAVDNLLSVVRRTSGVNVNLPCTPTDHRTEISNHTAQVPPPPTTTTTVDEETSVPSSSNIANAVGRARSMISFSTRRGTFSRLNQRERLRATTSRKPSSSSSNKFKVAEKKPFEFVLISTPGEYVDEPDQTIVMSEELIRLRGFIQIGSNATEYDIRKAICEAINKKHPLVSQDDFEFLKANRRKLMKPISSGEYNFNQIKLLAGQGSIYVKLKERYEYLLDPEYDLKSNDFDDELPVFGNIGNNRNQECDANGSTDIIEMGEQNRTITGNLNPPVNRPPSVEVNHSINTLQPEPEISGNSDPIMAAQSENNLEVVVDMIYKYCSHNTIVNPVEILRLAQKCVIRGRELEVTRLDSENEGETNMIVINRYDVLNTAKEELEDLSDPRLTLEVNFYGEGAHDLGGPRKEFLRLSLQEIKSKYFEHGFREELSEDYEFVGLILALSILQNGPLPRFMPDSMLKSIFDLSLSDDACVKNIRHGLDKLGLVMLCKKMPILMYLFQASNDSCLTRKKLLMLLEPEFSADGSNKRKFENEIYSFFVKYVREAAAGRLGTVTLSSILQFVTCCDNEPVLGFEIKPRITFPEASNGHKYDFLPKAHTCSFVLALPIHTREISIPPDAELFEIYNTAFLNAYFGRI